MALGPENFHVIVYQVDVNGTVVTHGDEVVVDPASNTKIGYQIKIGNSGASIFHWWVIGLTIYDVTHGKALGSEMWQAQGSESTTKNSERWIGTLTERTIVRVRVWANQDTGVSLPPLSEW